MGSATVDASRLVFLPAEIILETAKQLSDRNDVNNFAKSCHCLYELLNPYLYRQSVLHDNHALLWAADMGMDTTARQALRHGADVNATAVTDSPIVARSAKLAEPCHDDFRPQPRLTSWQGSTPLLLAIQSSHIHIVRLLLGREDVQINKENANKVTPVKLAIVEGHTEIFRLLLHHKDVDVNHTGLDHRQPVYSIHREPPLSVAVWVQNITCIQLLLAQKDIDMNRRGFECRTALHMACRRRNRHIAKMLLAHPDTDINAKGQFANSEYSVLDWALDIEKDWKFARLLLQYEALDRREARKYIADAAMMGYDDTVDLLLPHADASVFIETAQGAYMYFKQQRAEKLVKRLLKRQDIDFNATDDHGRTALHWAALSGSTTMAQILLDDGRIKTNVRDGDGFTPLHGAIHMHNNPCYGSILHDRENLGVIGQLLNQDDVDESLLNMRDLWGTTILHAAAATGHCSLVRQLLEFGSIDPNQRELLYDTTPVFMALIDGHVETALLLLRSSKATLTFNDIGRLMRVVAARGYRKIKTGLQSRLKSRI